MSLSDERNPYRQTAEKRFYFAKLPENFFEDKKIKYSDSGLPADQRPPDARQRP